MANFLVDVNLPYYFSLWNNPDFIHQIDINDSWTDSQIWEYAKKEGLILLCQLKKMAKNSQLTANLAIFAVSKISSTKIAVF